MVAYLNVYNYGYTQIEYSIFAHSGMVIRLASQAWITLLSGPVTVHDEVGNSLI
jgi:hypothetical protein